MKLWIVQDVTHVGKTGGDVKNLLSQKRRMKKMNNVLRILLDDDISDIILSKEEQEKAGVYEMTPEEMLKFVRLGDEIFS